VGVAELPVPTPAANPQLVPMTMSYFSRASGVEYFSCRPNAASCTPIASTTATWYGCSTSVQQATDVQKTTCR
jgi:hypothetical protein